MQATTRDRRCLEEGGSTADIEASPPETAMTASPTSGAQIAAARALTGVSREKLAGRAGVDLAEIARLERAGPDPIEPCGELTAVRTALEALGAVFIDEQGGDGAGVRLRFSRAQTRAVGAWEDEGGVPADDDIP